MNSDLYKVFIDNNCVAQNMPLQFAIILIKAIYTEFYAEPNLKVTIERIAKIENTTKENEVEELNE